MRKRAISGCKPVKRIHKLLEDANIKPSSVVSDIYGVSAQDMICNLIKENMTPKEMAELAGGPLRKKTTELEKALEGCLGEHHRLILKVSIQIIVSYDEATAKPDIGANQRMKQPGQPLRIRAPVSRPDTSLCPMPQKEARKRTCLAIGHTA